MNATVYEMWILLYVCLISLISIIITIYDKWASKNKKSSRIPEITLILLSAAGGSAAMYITMKAIRHKTKHKKFMYGIPVIIIIQVILAVSVKNIL